MKKRSYILSALLLIVAITYFILIQDFPKAVATLYYNANIITIEDTQPTAQAMYVKEGKIVAIGSNEALKAYEAQAKNIVDLEGKTVLPGFIDPHSHPALSTFLYNMVDLSGFTHNSEEELWAHLRKAVKNYEPNKWIICKGFDPILIDGLQSPHISFLDEIAPHNPLIILSQSLHSYWANSKAFEVVGVDKNTPNPTPASYYEKDSMGELTGFLAEQEAFKVFQDALLAAVTPEETIQTTLEVFKEYAKAGNTSVVGMGLTIKDGKALTLYEHLSAQKPKLLNQILVKTGLFPKRQALPRHFAYIRFDTPDLIPKSPDNGDDFHKIMGVKHWYDGSPYTGSMYLAQPYDTSELTVESFHLEAGHKGEALIQHDDLVNFIKDYHSKGWQIAVHTQGDLAIEEVLKAFETVHNTTAISDGRHRLEHNLLLPTTATTKMKTMNMTPSLHINHLYYYGKALENDIIGAERANKILPSQSVQSKGIPFSFHADQPMFDSNPFHLMQTAILRQTKEGSTLGASEAITPLEALKSMTIYAAWQLKMEEKIGSLKVGKYADFIIVDKDPLVIPTEDWLDIKVLKVFVSGNMVVFD